MPKKPKVAISIKFSEFSNATALITHNSFLLNVLINGCKLPKKFAAPKSEMAMNSSQISETANAKNNNFYFASRSSNSTFTLTTGFIFPINAFNKICQPEDSISTRNSSFLVCESEFWETENVKTAVSFDFFPFWKLSFLDLPYPDFFSIDNF